MHRDLRWRIGIAFWAILMAAFLFLGFRWNHLRFRQSALDYLKSRNATIEFSDQPRFYFRPLQPLVGNDAFRRVRHIDLSQVDVNTVDLVHVAAIEELESLDLRNAQFLDQGFSILAPLGNLQSLDLAGSSIGIGGIAKLPSENLRHLDLSHTAISDGAVEIIAGWSRLESLALCSIPASDTAFAELSNLPNLTHLNLAATSAGSETLKALEGHPRIKHLNLEKCPIRDTDLDSVAACQSIESLSIASTRIGDVGISRLSACKSLRKLVMRSTRATDLSLQALRPLLELNEIEAEDTEVSRAALENFRQRNSKQRKPLPGSGLGLKSPYVIGQVCECG